MLLGLGQEKYHISAQRSAGRAERVMLIFFLTQAQQHGTSLINYLWILFV